MKKILLSAILFVAVFGVASAQCPSDFKSNAGGGNCPNEFMGLTKTGIITLEYPNGVPSCLPTITQVVDQNGDVFSGPINFFQVSGNNKAVLFCAYGPAPKDNYFNQPDLILTLDFTSCTTGPYTGVYQCGPGSEIPLPVNFSSFNANRQNSTVAITWTTAFEQNNKGFYVQRNIAGVWTNVAFVFSQADGGNSTSALTYQYNDVNNTSGISQYRIQQVDIDGQTKYTDIRAVRGEGQTSKLIVYPNPSVNGNLNVVFEDNSSVRDVLINDIQGKIIRQYKQVSGNILLIEKLTSGFYTIKVTNRTTSATSVQKVVVK